MKNVYDVSNEDELYVALAEILMEKSDATVIIQLEQDVEPLDDFSDDIPF